MTTQVALVGGTGSLGRIIHGVIDQLDGFEVRSVLGSGSDLAEIEAGSAQMADAVGEFLRRRNGDVHEVLITHNFVISWFVREVLGAPDWRWMTLNQAHCGLTVIAQKQGRPWTLLSHNDLGHLPMELRTGLPEGALV